MPNIQFTTSRAYQDLAQENTNTISPWKTSIHAWHIPTTTDVQTMIISFKLKKNMLWTNCQNFSLI